jgi:hypothetical protein
MGGAGRPAADIATSGRAIELVDAVGAAVLVSLPGEPHVALRQFRPLRPQRRAWFPGSAGAQMGRKGANMIENQAGRRPFRLHENPNRPVVQ